MMGLILCRAIGVGCLKRYRFSPLEERLLKPMPIVHQFIVDLLSGEGSSE